MSTFVLDPESCVISAHALEQYSIRRRTRDPERGVRRLLGRAAAMEIPPVHVSRGRPARIYQVGELVLVLDTDLSVLITIFRRNPQKRPPPSRQRIHGRGR